VALRAKKLRLRRYQKAEDRDDDVGVCVNWRIPEQMPQTGRMGDVASGLRMGITASKGFICVDGRKCDYRRTHSQENDS
jgi:hypothetical protein